MPATEIHPTAFVAPGAELGAGVSVGIGAVIEADVQVGDGCRIEHHAVVRSHVRLGSGCTVDAHAVIGGLPQDLKFDPRLVTYVEVGDGTVFREACTIHRATAEGGVTVIGSSCYFMNNTHVAHDCTVGDRTIFATGATLGGHVEVGERVFFGGGAMAHQFSRVGSYVMVAGLIAVRKDVVPFALVGGWPVLHYRINTIGLRRAGIENERLRLVSRAFRRLRDEQPLDDLPSTPELDYLRAWLAAESKRGIYGFFRRDEDAAPEGAALDPERG